jgi:hypothetical protein
MAPTAMIPRVDSGRKYSLTSRWETGTNAVSCLFTKDHHFRWKYRLRVGAYAISRRKLLFPDWMMT